MKNLIFSILTIAISITQGQSFSNFCYDSRHIQSKKSSRLNGHVWRDFKKVSAIRCAHLCLILYRLNCRSFNYNKTTRLCELNSRNERDTPKALGTNTDFRFYQSKWFSPEFFDGYSRSHCLDKGPCGAAINFYGRVCYEVRQDKVLTYPEANLECNRKYGHLAMFPLNPQRSVMSTVMTRERLFGKYYIGMDDMDRDRKWLWVDKTPVDMTRPPWMPYQPDNASNDDFTEERCGGLEFTLRSEFGYNDVPCEMKWNFICQYEPWIYQNW